MEEPQLLEVSLESVNEKVNLITNKFEMKTSAKISI